LVREDRKQPQEADPFTETATYRYLGDVTETGGLGDPTANDPATVAEIVTGAAREVRVLDRDRRRDVRGDGGGGGWVI
jgi:hypothetical protein